VKKEKKTNPFFVLLIGCLFVIMSLVSNESNFISPKVKLILGLATIGYALYLLYQRKQNEQ
jgi:dipeptide/tripeptide permease